MFNRLKKKLFAEKVRINKLFLILKVVSYLIITAFCGLIIILVFVFLNFKTVYNEIFAGKENIEYAVQLIQDNKFDLAYNYAEMAEDNFTLAEDKVTAFQENIIIENSKFISSQLYDISKLISSARILSQGIKEGIVFGNEINKIVGENTNYNSLDTSEKEAILKIIFESTPELNGIKANIDIALVNIEKIQYHGFLILFENKIELFKTYLKSAQDFFDTTIPISHLLPKMLGYPEKSSFLLVMQNKDELRPTGGFIGTYGILETKNSEIKRLDTHDIYHMDMPVKDFISVKPPEPIAKYLVPKWYMRDANWSPDWEISAKQIEWFFYEEDALLPKQDQINNFKGKFDGVIGITPQLVTDLLEYTGPVIIEGEEYTHENFTQLLEYRVEKGFMQLGIPSWHRKEVIGDIMEVLKKRVFNLKGEELRKVYDIVKENLIRKNVLVYFRDEYFENIVKEQGWGGEIKNVSSDYLYVVDANLGAYKTDMVMNRQLNYKVDFSASGVFSDLFVNYSHNGNYDWRTTDYKTYTRIYVPFDSELILSDGFDSEIEVYVENGKTVFAGFMKIPPGKIRTLHFKYKLPNNIVYLKNKGLYGLYLQKQPGKDVDTVNIDISSDNNIKSYWPTGFYVNVDDKNIRWETNLNTDREFIVGL